MAPEFLQSLAAAVRDVPDFPKAGILFKDITPILADAALLKTTIDAFTEAARPLGVNKVVGIDARGFILGAPLAIALGVGFVPVRKKGKLPYQCQSAAYQLEYGEAVVEMHTDAIAPGEKVVLIDDLLATGGTAAAAVTLVEALGGIVAEIQFLIELTFLDGRAVLGDRPVRALLTY
ncbi:MAG: adenine phosphoribosyltransferase [Chthoniobacteraceae bacterium]